MYKSSLILLCTGLVWLGTTTELFAQSVNISGGGIRIQVGNQNYRGSGHGYRRYTHRERQSYRGPQVIINTGGNECCDCYDSYNRDRYYRQTNDYYPGNNYPYYQRYRGYRSGSDY